MAVIYIGEHHWGREGEDTPLPSAPAGGGYQGQQQIVRARKYERLFMLRTTVTTDGIVAVLACPNLPKEGDSHPDDGDAKCVRRRASNLREHWKLWNATCYYETPQRETRKYRYGSERSEVVPSGAFTSQNGGRDKAIVNSVKEQFDPPPTVPRFRGTITISDVVDTFDPAIKRKYEGKISSTDTTVRGYAYPAGTLMITSYLADSEIIGGQAKWRITVTLLDEPEGHKLSLFDYGTGYYKDTTDAAAGTKTPFKTKDKSDCKGRLDGGAGSHNGVPNNGFGGKLAPNAADKFIDFDVFQKENFAFE